MAQYCQVASGNASGANIGRVTAVATAHASNTTSDFTSLGAAVSTDTFTAPSLVDQAYGVGVFLTSNNLVNGAVIRAILQHDIGAGFVDTTCIVDYTVGSGTAGTGYSDYVFFNAYAAGTAFTFATTTANKYRWRIYKLSGTGTLLRARSSTTGSSTAWGFFVDSRTATIGATEDYIVPNGITGTLTNGMSFGTAAGTSQSTNPTVFAQQAVMVLPEGICQFDTSASTTVTVKGMIAVAPYGTFRIGTESVAYPSSYVGKLILDQNGTAGNHAIWSTAGNIIINGGYQPTNYMVNYVSGLGTAASPMITDGDIGAVGDEVLISTTGNYNQTEYRFIITKNSSTSYVLSSTSGGAENALVNTHSARAKVANLQRNVILEPLNTAHAFYILHAGTSALGKFYGKNFRTNYIGNSGTGKFGLTLGYSGGQATMVIQELSGIVSNAFAYNGFYLQSNRTDYTTYTDNIFCRTTGGQPGVTLSGTNNKIFEDWGFFDLSVSAMGWQGANNITLNRPISHGINTGNGSNNGHFNVSVSCAQVVINDGDFQWSRQQAIRNLAVAMTGWTFNNCSFGDVGTNVTEIAMANGSLMDVVFNRCTFASPTLISNYLNMIEGSYVGFQNYNDGDTDHFWYTNHGKGQSAGAGLTDTTVRTASSLSLVLKPEDATYGQTWTHNIPANTGTNVFENGYVYRNATFSSGTAKVELWLPTTSLSAAPDASYTFPTTTGSWLPYLVSAYYSGSVSGLATVKVTAITATAGAYLFVDDLYDAALNNKLAGIDIWLEGRPSNLIAAVDASAVPGLVWNYPSTPTTSGTMGQSMSDNNTLIKGLYGK